MTKAQIGYRSGENGRTARSFLNVPYSATCESVAQRLVDDSGGRYGQKHKERSTTIPITFDHILARISLLQKVSLDEGYTSPRFSSLANPKGSGRLAFPALVLSDYPGASGPARKLLFSLGSEDEVEWHFNIDRQMVIPKPLVIGAKAIQYFEKLNSQHK